MFKKDIYLIYLDIKSSDALRKLFPESGSTKEFEKKMDKNRRAAIVFMNYWNM